MICSNCNEFKLILNVEEYIVRNSPKDSSLLIRIFTDYFDIAEEEIICNNCGCKISSGESYLKDCKIDDVMEILYEYIGEEINKKIVACESCSELNNIFIGIRMHFNEEDDDPEGMIDDLNTAHTIDELICNNFNIDSNDEIIKYIYILSLW